LSCAHLDPTHRAAGREFQAAQGGFGDGGAQLRAVQEGDFDDVHGLFALAARGQAKNYDKEHQNDDKAQTAVNVMHDRSLRNVLIERPQYKAAIKTLRVFYHIFNTLFLCLLF
jgi:hypothetical protein